MTILNIHIKDDDKKKVQKLVKLKKEKSMSDFIRKLLAEHIKIQEILQKREKNNDIEMPDYIPKNKYVGFVNGAIIEVSNSPSEISQIAAEKFPNLPLIIKYNGPKKKHVEYCFMALSELKCWNYVRIEDYSYPTLPISFQTSLGQQILSASIDTASSLCVLRTGTVPSDDLKISREEQVSTAAGIIDTKIFPCKIKIFDIEFKTEFIFAPIAEIFPFQLLIGRNLLDKLDAYLFGKRQIFCLKLAE